MGDQNVPSHDYSTGVPRRHHSLYIDDGNFVIQVENAIFKIHRYFLAKYSPVIWDMLQSPQGSGSTAGSDPDPLILSGDKVSGWELLLEDIYDRDAFASPKTLTNREKMLSLLQIAHKYCMDKVEGDVLKKLKKTSGTAAYLDLIVASQIIGSDDLYQAALKGAIASGNIPDLAQVRRIGTEAQHSITIGVFAALKTAHATQLSNTRAAFDNKKCRHCQRTTNWQCSGSNCQKHQG